uniref:(northern house mosquito) hypothetical protein n=2 Tax=Culex pipiens TaxID=7175 RepID=A0A8D8JA08_CULPI
MAERRWVGCFGVKVESSSTWMSSFYAGTPAARPDLAIDGPFPPVFCTGSTSHTVNRFHFYVTANVAGSTVHFFNNQASDRSNGADSPAILNLIHPSRFAPFSSYFALANPLSFSWRFLVVTSATTPACSVGSVHWRWTATRVGMFRSPAFTGFPFGMLIYASRNNSLTTLEANLTTGYTLPSLG